MFAAESLDGGKVLAKVIRRQLAILLTDAALSLVDVANVSVDFASITERLLPLSGERRELGPNVIDFLKTTG